MPRLKPLSNLCRIVEDAVEVEFNSNLSNLIILDVELHMHFIPEFDSVHVKFDF